MRFVAIALLPSAGASLRISSAEVPSIPSELDVSRPNLTTAEIEGRAPVFVEAFLGPLKAQIFIVLSTKILQRNVMIYEDLATATWHCGWTDPSKGLGHSVTFLRETGEIPGDSTVHDAHRKTLVVRCRVPKKKLKEMQQHGEPLLRIEATTSTGKQLYKREGIHVRENSIFGTSRTGLCTMAIKEAVASPYIAEWVGYHLHLGFDQIVVYIEDKDPSWARVLLQDFIDQGNVRLVHFYFGALSDKRSWTMQQAQEQHCLYQARGKVFWLGHSDIDEYFQIMEPGGTLKGFLDEVPTRLQTPYPVAVSVQSAMWYFHSDEEVKLAQRLPCDMTCKAPGFDEVRTKLIMSPERVDYFSVHQLTRYVGRVYFPTPHSEIRLNHFKAVPDGVRLGDACNEDHSFQHVCVDIMDNAAGDQAPTVPAHPTWSPGWNDPTEP